MMMTMMKLCSNQKEMVSGNWEFKGTLRDKNSYQNTSRNVHIVHIVLHIVCIFNYNVSCYIFYSAMDVFGISEFV